MKTEDVAVAAIDKELSRLIPQWHAVGEQIARLQKARRLLSRDIPVTFSASPPKKRFLNGETRAKIAATQKKRWAERKGRKDEA